MSRWLRAVGLVAVILLGGCAAAGGGELQSSVSQGQVDAAMAFLATTKPEKVMFDGEPAAIRGVVVATVFSSSSAENSWSAVVVLPDGSTSPVKWDSGMNVTSELNGHKRLNDLVHAGDYIAAKGTRVKSTEVTVLVKDAI